MVLGCGIANLEPASAQAPGILTNGNAVVTGFSGAPLPAQLPPGVNPADLTFIDLNGASARVVELQAPGAPPQAQLITAPLPFRVTAAQVGQVFAVALDAATPPNIYVAATSAYGLPIVIPGQSGAFTRVYQGMPGASFMPGLFGPAAQGGGPGSIWRIDGATGAVSLFANVMLGGVANSGPGLGGLAFDGASKTLIVADRDTGMIHRFALTGAEVGRYDHGTQGLMAAGLPLVAFDPSKRLDITSPNFSTQDPSTWSYAPPARRVFGLAVHGGRLYYAVAAGLQVWSVSIAADGSFGSDARVEIPAVPGNASNEISKITFDDQGRMLLAERAAPTGAADFVMLAAQSAGLLLRYQLSPPANAPAPPAIPVAPPTIPVAPPVSSDSPPTIPIAPPADPLAPPAIPVAPPANPLAPPAIPVAPPANPLAIPVAPLANPVAPLAAPGLDEYAIGFYDIWRNSTGGTAVGYGYDAAGRLNPSSCGAYLWTTGDQLRNAADPTLATQLSTTGRLNITGLQGNAIDLVRPADVPPLQSYFAELDDGPANNDAARGHLADIAISSRCGQASAAPRPAPNVPVISQPGGLFCPAGQIFAPLTLPVCQFPLALAPDGTCAPPPTTDPSGLPIFCPLPLISAGPDGACVVPPPSLCPFPLVPGLDFTCVPPSPNVPPGICTCPDGQLPGPDGSCPLPPPPTTYCPPGQIFTPATPPVCQFSVAPAADGTCGPPPTSCLSGSCPTQCPSPLVAGPNSTCVPTSPNLPAGICTCPNGQLPGPGGFCPPAAPAADFLRRLTTPRRTPPAPIPPPPAPPPQLPLPTGCTFPQVLINNTCMCANGGTLIGGVCVLRGQQPKPPVRCEPPRVLLGNTCACPDGGTFRGGKCLPPTKPPIQCELPRKLLDNTCACPDGGTFRDGKCLPPTKPAPVTKTKTPPKLNVKPPPKLNVKPPPKLNLKPPPKLNLAPKPVVTLKPPPKKH